MTSSLTRDADPVDPHSQGKEFNGYSGKNSHVESGLGASTVSIQQFTSPANIIKVTVLYGTLKHCKTFLPVYLHLYMTSDEAN